MLDSLGISTTTIVSTALLGPGGAITTQLATRVYAEMGDQLLQGAGDFLGLSQLDVSSAQSFFAAEIGDRAGVTNNLDDAIAAFGGETGASPSDIGEAQREARDVINQQAASLAESDDAKEARASGGGKSWIMALARALGEKLDAKAEEVSALADQITDDKPSITAKFGAASQEFNVMMSAATTAIKTIGEALATMAKRQ